MTKYTIKRSENSSTEEKQEYIINPNSIENLRGNTELNM